MPGPATADKIGATAAHLCALAAKCLAPALLVLAQVLVIAPAALGAAAAQAAGSAAGSAAGQDADPALLQRLATSLAAATDGQDDRFDAEVWLTAGDTRLARFMPKRSQRLDLLRLVHKEARRQNLDPDLVLAVMEVESHFDRFAVSRAGAQGLLQIMPFWKLELGRSADNLMDPAVNLRYGTTILAHYLTVAKDDLVEALARYNGSRGQTRYPNKVIRAWRQRWRSRPTGEIANLYAACRKYSLPACGP